MAKRNTWGNIADFTDRAAPAMRRYGESAIQRAKTRVEGEKAGMELDLLREETSPGAKDARGRTRAAKATSAESQATIDRVAAREAPGVAERARLGSQIDLATKFSNWKNLPAATKAAAERMEAGTKELLAQADLHKARAEGVGGSGNTLSREKAYSTRWEHMKPLRDAHGQGWMRSLEKGAESFGRMPELKGMNPNDVAANPQEALARLSQHVYRYLTSDAEVGGSERWGPLEEIGLENVAVELAATLMAEHYPPEVLKRLEENPGGFKGAMKGALNALAGGAVALVGGAGRGVDAAAEGGGAMGAPSINPRGSGFGFEPQPPDPYEMLKGEDTDAAINARVGALPESR